MTRLSIVLPLLAVLTLSACAGRDPRPVSTVLLSVDGPPLAIYGEYAGMTLAGTMERTCMAGYGSLVLERIQPESPAPLPRPDAADKILPGIETQDALHTESLSFLCEAAIDDPPTEKARVRGQLRCSGGRIMLFSLRNIGPDQGVGIARETDEGDLMVFFYHASADEARRRYPSVKKDIDRARSGQPRGEHVVTK